jgi:hypothetical protein
VVDKLLGTIPDLAYYFFVIKDKDTLDGMLASALVQLATDAGRHKILADTYNTDKHRGPPSLQSLLNCFEKMLEVPRDLVLVLDALDEHPQPRVQLLRFLISISQKDHVRLLVVSRNEDDIRAAMQSLRAAEIDLKNELKQKEELYNYITAALLEEPFLTWKTDHPGTVLHPGPVDFIKKRLFEESMQVFTVLTQFCL